MYKHMRLHSSYFVYISLCSILKCFIMSDEMSKEFYNDIRYEIRSYMVARGQTYQSVANLLNKKFGLRVTAQSLNNKLARGSLRYSDAKLIADVLGYKIKWE